MTLDNLFGQYGFERIYSEEILEDTDQESTIAVLYRKTGRIAEIKKDVVSSVHIENFIKDYSEVDKQLEDTLRRIVESGSEVVLYGIGARLLQLMKAHSVFEHMNVVGCIDGNKSRQGERISIGSKSYVIQDLSELEPNDNIAVLICVNSKQYENEIKRALSEKGYKNVIVV